VTPPTTLEQAIQVIEAQALEIELLRERLALMQKGRFGRGTETLSPGQLALFEDLPAAAEEASEPALPASPKPAKLGKGHGRASFPEHLPRELVELDLAADQRCCPDCGCEMRPIGEDVTERGHIIPARLMVRRYVRKIPSPLRSAGRTEYACPAGHAVKTAPLPDGVIAKGKYEASVYAHVAAAKYADHLPLHRLEGIFKRHGMRIPKQTMWDMLVTVDEQLAQPVLEQMRRELLAEPVLHADETPIPMRLEEGKGKQTVYAWAWRNLRAAGDSKVLLDFRRSRARDGPIDFLGSWSGTLIGDAYAGYDEVCRRNGITRGGCMSHARRKAKDALDVGTKKAIALLRPIQRLFWIERAVQCRAERLGLDWDGLVELRRQVRAKRSRVVWDQLQVAVEALRVDRGTLPKSRLGEAVTYLVSQKEPLSAFLRDPRLPIHNNDAERVLRHLAIGRNNWMIFGGLRGGDVACRLYSLVLSCKESGVDPQAYLEDVLGRLGTTPMSEIASLTPWGWKAARAEAQAEN